LSFIWITAAQAQGSQDERQVIFVILTMFRRLGGTILVEIGKWWLKVANKKSARINE